MKLRTSIVAAALVLAGSAFAQAEAVKPEAVSFADGAVSQSLTGVAGDVDNGRKVFADRSLGNCLACHKVTEMTEHLFHGEVGPELDGVADRYDETQLRGIIVNAKQMFTEETIMPGFYSLEVGMNVRKDLVGKTILTPEQVEDVVAYLATLKE
jgi:sulfur-oxidizing protein SoxX